MPYFVGIKGGQGTADAVTEVPKDVEMDTVSMNERHIILVCAALLREDPPGAHGNISLIVVFRA